MPPYDLTHLNSEHAIPNHLRFHRDGDGPTLAEVDNPHGNARIALEGGQVLAWTPKGHEAVIWLGPAAVYKPGKSLRGGIPVCWPWFGPHPSDPALPAHGFARNKPWRVATAEPKADGATHLILVLEQDEETRRLWPFDAELRLSITIGPMMRLALTTYNTGDVPITIGEALHTYFQIGDIESVAVEGLDGCDYVDKVSGGGRRTQQGPVTVGGEVDRVYADTSSATVIDDPRLHRRIRIAKSGSRSTVVWNPWVEKSAGFPDMAEGDYRRMLCVETANALAPGVTIEPGAEHTLMAEYRVEGRKDT